MVPALRAFIHVFLRWLCQPACASGGALPGSRAMLAGLLLVSTQASAWQPPEAVSVQASRQGPAIRIETSAVVKAPLDVIWNTLTDYNRLAEFIPGMVSSRILERRGNILTVEQTGSARLWLFSYSIDVVVQVTEQKPHTINVSRISGNLKQLEGGYQLELMGDGSGDYLLKWTGVIEPPLPLPSAVALTLIRNNVTQQFEGMVHEIERREARRTHSVHSVPR